MLQGFERVDFDRDGVRIAAWVAGRGPALVLLHGHPQTHVMWHRVAAELARHHRVVAFDLRGYGDSGRPPADPAHQAHSKREMALDVLHGMRMLGDDRFQVLAHDRGARVAHRLAVDHPQAVERMLLLDIAPTLAMYERTTREFALAYWHWFFLVQPAPLPERLIEADPAAYVHELMGRRHAGLEVFHPDALAAYTQALSRPGSATSVCEDYRASAGVDLEHDRQDIASGRRLHQPLRVLWGRQGAVGRCFDVLALWRERASDVGGRALDCGHYIAEEAPQELVIEARTFFRSESP